MDSVEYEKQGMFPEYIYPVDPNVIIAGISRKLSSWSMLQKPRLRDRQRCGASRLLAVAPEIFSRSKGWAPIVWSMAEPTPGGEDLWLRSFPCVVKGE